MSDEEAPMADGANTAASVCSAHSLLAEMPSPTERVKC